MAMVVVSCTVCGKEHKRHDSRVGVLNYCSAACRRVHAGTVDVVCSTCGKELRRPKSRVYEKSYCDRVCQDADVRKEVACARCGKLHQRPATKVRGKNYCSYECKLGDLYAWVGWMVANSGKMSRAEAAAYMGVSVVRFNSMMIVISRALRVYGMAVHWNRMTVAQKAAARAEEQVTKPKKVRKKRAARPKKGQVVVPVDVNGAGRVVTSAVRRVKEAKGEDVVPVERVKEGVYRYVQVGKGTWVQKRVDI